MHAPANGAPLWPDGGSRYRKVKAEAVNPAGGAGGLTGDVTVIRYWQDWVSYFLGLWVFGSPWFIEHAMIGTQPEAGSRGMVNLWVVGRAVVLLTTLAISGNMRARFQLAVFALGAWLLLRPGSSVSPRRRH
jgi:hypothetical protein